MTFPYKHVIIFSFFCREEANKVYQAILPRDFNSCWKSLNPKSIKASIIHSLSSMSGYGQSYEKFVEDFDGKGKISVEPSQVIINFEDLRVLGINLEFTSPADIDHIFREKLTNLADAKTPADKIIALGKIIGTEINGISTTPSKQPQYHLS